MSPELPKTWSHARALITGVVAAAIATAASLGWANSQVRSVAEAATQRVADDLAAHKAVEDVRHEYEDAHLKSIDETLKEISRKLDRR